MIIYGPISSVSITPRGYLLISGEPVSPEGVCWGKPNVEPEGVSNRRFAVSYPFTQEDLVGLPAGLIVAEELPGDWRSSMVQTN